LTHAPASTNSPETFNIVTKATIDKYGIVLTRAVAFVLRKVIGWQSTYDCPLTPAQTSNAEKLLDDLRMQANDGQIESHIHALLYSLFAHIPTDYKEDKYFSPINRALVLMSIRDGGAWLAAGEITQIIAAMVYSIRSTMFFQLHRLARQRRQRVHELSP
jgi:hypothetical protein